MTGSHIIAIIICSALATSVVVSIVRLIRDMRKKKEQNGTGGSR